MTPEIIAADPGWPYSKAKTAVLAAAAAVIREDGPRAATLKNIAGRAGITEPAIFRHFEGVDGLFGGLFHAFERICRRFDQAFENEEQGLARFRAAMLGIVDIIAASRDFAYILIHAEQVFRGYPDLRRRVTEYTAKDQENALDCIQDGVASGEIRGDVDPESVAAVAIGMVHITAMFWVDSGFAFDLREVCQRRWDDLERLMTTRAGARRADRSTGRIAEGRSSSRVTAALKPGKPASVTSSSAGARKSLSADSPKSGGKAAKAKKSAKPTAPRAAAGSKRK